MRVGEDEARWDDKAQEGGEGEAGVSAEFWAIIGLAAVVWITGMQIIEQLKKLREETRRPLEPNGEDKLLNALGRIEQEITDWRYTDQK